MSTEWTLLFEGEVWRVKILQSQLDGNDIETFVPDEYVPSSDPHFSGTPMQTTALFVRPADAERARALLAGTHD